MILDRLVASYMIQVLKNYHNHIKTTHWIKTMVKKGHCRAFSFFFSSPNSRQFVARDVEAFTKVTFYPRKEKTKLYNQ